MDILGVIETLGTVLLGGGMFAFVEFLINRHDRKHDKQEEILESIEKIGDKVTKLEETMEERDAVLARTHILRFRDELYNGEKHTQEYFDQTLDDIRTYDEFCEDHPKFANGRTIAASEFIREEYKRLFKEHKL